MSKSILKEFKERQSIQEILEKDERFEVIGTLTIDQYRYLARAKHKESGKEVIIKIPLTPEARQECLMPYNLVKEAHKPQYLVRLVGEEPVEFKGNEKEYFGILLVPAVTSLEKIVQHAIEDDKSKEGEDEASKQAWEDEVLNVFHQAALSLSEIHRLGYLHRDMKLSNLLGYDDDVWVIADYGTLTKNDQKTKPKSTHSAKNAEQFQSPELIERKEGIRYSVEEDIFAFGMALYMALTKKLSNDLYRKQGYQAFIDRKIPELDVSDRAKYFLKRLLGRKLITKPRSGKTVKDYRYRSIDIFLAEFNGETVSEDVENVVSSEDYTNFLEAHKEFMDALNSAEHNRDGKWGTVNYVTIDKIMEAHGKFLELANREKIKLAPKRNELVTTSIEVYEDIRAREEELLRGVFKRFESGEIDKEEFWPSAYEIVYLWGPPFTDRKDDKKTGEKARYVIEEIRAKRTHFHDKIFEKKSREEGTSEEGKSLVELLDGFGELSDEPSESSEEAHVHLKSGNSWFNVGNFDRSISEYEEAIKLDSSYAAAYNNLGVARGRKEDFDGAVSSFKKAIEIKPEDVKAHNNLGNIYLKQKHLEAIGEYEIALELEPGNVAALNNLGVAWYRLANDNDSAIENLEKAVELDPKNATIHFNLANALKAKGDVVRSTSEYNTALDLSRKKSELVEDAEKDIREAREAIEKDPQDKEAYFKLGLALGETGDRKGSIEAYLKVIEIDPDYGVAHNNLGVDYMKEDSDKSIKCYREAIRCGPTNALYHNNLAKALERKGELDEAEKEFKETISCHKACGHDRLYLGEIYCSLGGLYQNKGDIDKAIETYKEGIKYDPVHTPLQERLRNLLETKKDAKAIIDDLKRQGEEKPNEAFAQVFLGIALSLGEDVEGSNSAYERAANLIVGSKGETIDLMEENARRN